MLGKYLPLEEKGGSDPLPNYSKSNFITTSSFSQLDNWQSLGYLISDVIEDSFVKSVENIGSKRHAQ